MAIPQAQEIQVPTKDQLTAQLNNLIIQRASFTDQIDAIEKQLPVLNGMIQILSAQEAVAQAAADKLAAQEAEGVIED